MSRMPRPSIIAVAAGVLVAVVVAVVVAVALIGPGDGDGPEATPSTEVPTALQEAVLRAEVSMAGVDPGDLGEMIEELCGSRDGAALAGLVVATGLTDRDDIRQLIEGVGRGAMSYCPDVSAEEPQLLNEAYNEAIAQLDDG